MINKLFFYRHIINGSVILSKTHTLKNQHLSQVGLHRPGIIIRRDHWTQFLQFESTDSDLSYFHDNLLVNHKYPLPKVRYPLPMKSLVWTVPEKVEFTINKLHTLLQNHPISSGKMLWERLEYQKSDTLTWPGTISHDKLQLKNSIPDSKPEKVKTFISKTRLEY